MKSVPVEISHMVHTDAVRDHFIMAALTGILANPNVRVIHPADVAKLACQHADAALAERRR